MSETRSICLYPKHWFNSWPVVEWQRGNSWNYVATLLRRKYTGLDKYSTICSFTRAYKRIWSYFFSNLYLNPLPFYQKWMIYYTYMSVCVCMCICFVLPLFPLPFEGTRIPANGGGARADQYWPGTIIQMMKAFSWNYANIDLCIATSYPLLELVYW